MQGKKPGAKVPIPNGAAGAADNTGTAGTAGVEGAGMAGAVGVVGVAGTAVAIGAAVVARVRGHPIPVGEV